MTGHSVAFLTKHGKETIVAPILAQAQLMVHVVGGFDTDQWGTFSGEVERPASQRETAVMKAKKALELCPEATLGLGSEGAFHPHPANPFITMNTEMLALVFRNNLTSVVGVAQSTEVHFCSEDVQNEKELKTFIQKSGFPEYGIILKLEVDGRIIATEKECLTSEALAEGFQRLRSKGLGRVIAETDLRAHRNPARRQVIHAAALDLLARWNTLCPRCGGHGFGFSEIVPGLPCAFCHFPTRLPKREVWKCPHCGVEEYRKPAHGLLAADPSVCSVCNP
ncbi:MAG: hypothetical protein N2110_05915 [Flavobacteriales bacterium]|nr:hypothetical protein [Flavobacteriales bacterium]MCX7768540.1 hypothetical protein [Flavobacteriales bacterium]MDW8410214.1 hypothetical protein [Flavobacteriales bacterium]